MLWFNSLYLTRAIRHLTLISLVCCLRFGFYRKRQVIIFPNTCHISFCMLPQRFSGVAYSVFVVFFSIITESQAMWDDNPKIHWKMPNAERKERTVDVNGVIVVHIWHHIRHLCYCLNGDTWWYVWTIIFVVVPLGCACNIKAARKMKEMSPKRIAFLVARAYKRSCWCSRIPLGQVQLLSSNFLWTLRAPIYLSP